MILATTKFADWDRFWSSSAPRAPRSAPSTAARARSSSATRTRRTACGPSSTGTTPAGRRFVSDPVGPARHEGSRAHLIKPYTLGVPRRDRGLRTGHDDVSNSRSHQGRASSPTSPARCPSWASRTPTWPTWSCDDLNAAGGLLGRPLQPDRRGQRHRRRRRGGRGHQDGRRARRRRRARRHLQLDAAGDQGPRGRARTESSTSTPSSTRGRSRDPLIFCTGPVPAQQIEPALPVAHGAHRREDLLPPVGRLHLAARAEREGPRGRHRRRRLHRGRGVPPARPHGLRRDRGAHHGERRGRRVQHHRPARAHARSSRSCTRPGSRGEEGTSCAPTSTRTSSTSCRPSRSRGSTAASTTTARSTDPFSADAPRGVRAPLPGAAPSSRPAARARACTAASGCGRRPSPRPARSTPEAVVKALDTASLAEGPGGPAEMVPGPAPPAAEHVHRAGRRRPLRGRREARHGRPQGGPGRGRLTALHVPGEARPPVRARRARAIGATGRLVGGPRTEHRFGGLNEDRGLREGGSGRGSEPPHRPEHVEDGPVGGPVAERLRPARRGAGDPAEGRRRRRRGRPGVHGLRARRSSRCARALRWAPTAPCW